jgi:hypothetical protein
MKKVLLGVVSALVLGLSPVVALADTNSQATTSTLVPISTFSNAISSNGLKSDVIQPLARGSEGPYYVSGVAKGYAEEFTVATTNAGGISVGGYFGTGAQIYVVSTANSNQQYTGPVISGTVTATNDYVNCPSGTYDVYIANPTNSTQSYGPLTVYYN